MPTEDDEQDDFLKFIMLELIQKLRNHPGISNVKFEKKLPCSRLAVRAWEQNAGFKLPTDMKAFYASRDGLNFVWSISQTSNLNEGKPLILTGEIKINTLVNLRRLHFLNQRKFNSLMHSRYAFHKLNINKNIQDVIENKSKILAAFIISWHNKLGNVCLVYHSKQTITDTNNSLDSDSSIWLLDTANCWHFLANNFCTYFRMALVHLGLEKWQSSFTSYGATETTQRIMLLLTPNLLREIQNADSVERDDMQIAKNVIDPSIFKTASISSKSTKPKTNKN